jgi:hypothetical protein
MAHAKFRPQGRRRSCTAIAEERNRTVSDAVAPTNQGALPKAPCLSIVERLRGAQEAINPPGLPKQDLGPMQAERGLANYIMLARTGASHC